MLKRKSILIAAIFSIIAFTFAASSTANAKVNEYDLVVKHLKTKYRAKKVSIPFLWLARAAVRVVRPAGVKTFNVTLFENLQFSRDTLDEEMQMAMRDSFTPEWSPIFHVRSREGQQAYMYIREDGKDVRIMLVTIETNQAAIIRARFSPEKLADFINDPKIFGVSLSDGDQDKSNQNKPDKPSDKKEATAPVKQDG